MTGPALAADGVTVEARGRAILRDVSLRLEPGERLALVGPNGAGKSTLLRVLTGTLRPTAGRVELGGVPVASLERSAIARRLAVVPQQAALPFAMRVEEVVALGRLPHEAPLRGARPSDRAAVAGAIERVGLGHLLGRDARELSLGERQLVLLAMAVAQAAPVLLLDEPTVHLDLRHQVEAMELLVDLNERDGTAIVAVLHDLGLAAHFFPRIAVLDHGRLVADGPPREALSDDLVREVFGVDPAIVRLGAAVREGSGSPRLQAGIRLNATGRTPAPHLTMAVMRIEDFELERFFARYEFAVRHLLCASDVQGWPMADLLALADAESAELWHDLRLGYTESLGHPLLRREIAALYDTVTDDEVLVFSGAEEAIFVLANVLLGPGDHAVVAWPSYQSLHEVARSTGAAVTLLELRAEDGWAIDLDRLRGQLRPSTKLIVINAPHNPTGAMPDAATYRALVDLAADAGATLLVDEVYRFLERDPLDRLPAGADAGPHVVSIGVMSKSFALAGLRIGWLATHDASLLDAAARFKDYTTICASAPAEVLSLIALRARDEVLARSRSIVDGNVALLDPFFERQAGRFRWVRPRGGPVGFPELIGGVPIDRFAQDLVEAEGVLLAPGSIFGHPGNHFRLGFGRTDLPVALAALEAFADRTLPRDA